MYYAYILRSSIGNRFYSGYTANLKKRLKQHINNEVHTTKRMSDFKLVFYEAFRNRADALQRERYFKTTKGKRTLKLMLKGFLNYKAPSSNG